MYNPAMGTPKQIHVDGHNGSCLFYIEKTVPFGLKECIEEW